MSEITRREFIWFSAAAYPFLALHRFIVWQETGKPSDQRKYLSSVVDASRFYDSPRYRNQYAGLLIGTGITSRYVNKKITRAEAEAQFESLVGGGLISDPKILSGLHDALHGAASSSFGDDTLGKVFATEGTLIGVLAALPVAAPIMVPLTVAGAAVTLLGTWEPEISSSIGNALVNLDPNLAFPEPDRIILAGAFAQSAMADLAQREKAGAALLQEYIPKSGVPLQGVLDSGGAGLASLKSLSGEDRAFISEAIDAANEGTSADIRAALTKVTDKLFLRITEVQRAAEESVDLLKANAAAEKKRMSDAALEQSWQYATNQVLGAVAVVDGIVRLVFQDPKLADQFSGLCKLGVTTANLIRNAASMGTLAFAGGMVSVVEGAFGLFGPSQNDFLMEQLGQINSKLDALADMIQQGFRAIDTRLVEIEKLSAEILNDLIAHNLQVQERLAKLDESITLVGRSVTVNERQDRENFVEHDVLLSAYQDLSKPMSRLLPTKLRATVTQLHKFAARQTTEEPHSGWLGGERMTALITRDEQFAISNDPFVYQFGFLKPAIRNAFAAATFPESRFAPTYPNPDRWSEAVHSILELLVIHSDTDISFAAPLIQELWLQGSTTRADTISATSEAALLRLVTRVESLTLSDRSAGRGETVDKKLMNAIRSLPGHSDLLSELRNSVMNLGPSADQFLEFALTLKFLVAALRWRFLRPNGVSAYYPETTSARDGVRELKLLDIPLVATSQELAELAIEVATSQLAGSDLSAMSTPALNTKLSKAVTRAYREQTAMDLDRIRQLVISLRSKPDNELGRCGSLDNVLRPLHNFARVHRIPLQQAPTPNTRIDLRESDFEGAQTLLPSAMRDFIISMTERSLDGFETLRPASKADPKTGISVLRPKFCGHQVEALLKEPGFNPTGAKTFARVRLPAPLSREDASEQFSIYSRLIRSSFPRIEEDFILPAYLKQYMPEPTVTIDGARVELSRNFFWSPVLSEPFVAACLTYHLIGQPEVIDLSDGDSMTVTDTTRCSSELYLWILTPTSCGFG